MAKGEKTFKPPTIANAKLKDGNGTAYSGSNMAAAMARIDGLGGQPGCFSVKWSRFGSDSRGFRARPFRVGD